MIDLRVETVDGWGLLFTPLALRAVRFGAQTPQEVVRAIERCRTELEIAGHERWRGHAPSVAELGDADHDALTLPKPAAPPPPAYSSRGEQPWRTGGNGRERDPSEYVLRADGTVESPGGKHIRDPGAVQRILMRRLRAGASITPETYDLSGLSRRITRAAVADGVTPHEWVSAQLGVALQAPRRRRGSREPTSGQLALIPAAVVSEQEPAAPAPTRTGGRHRRLRSAS